MDSAASHQVAALLQAWNQGDERALESLAPLIDQDLRRVATRVLGRGHPDPILDAGALVNEAYVRLIDLGQASWQDGSHFFAACAQIMRHIVTDYARARRAAKRGGDRRPIPLDETLASTPEPSPDSVAMDELLNALSGIDPRKRRVVELRFFRGLSSQETAEILKVSPETVRRDWRLARAWLMRELREASHSASNAMPEIRRCRAAG